MLSLIKYDQTIPQCSPTCRKKHEKNQWFEVDFPHRLPLQRVLAPSGYGSLPLQAKGVVLCPRTLAVKKMASVKMARPTFGKTPSDRPKKLETFILSPLRPFKRLSRKGEMDQVAVCQQRISRCQEVLANTCHGIWRYGHRKRLYK